MGRDVQNRVRKQKREGYVIKTTYEYGKELILKTIVRKVIGFPATCCCPTGWRIRRNILLVMLIPAAIATLTVMAVVIALIVGI